MKHSLGRGIEALMPLKPENVREKDISEIPVEKIIPLENQARKFFDRGKIMELAESIRETGMIQPIIVRKKDDRYQIIAGERRFQAVRELKMPFIPAIIRNYNDNEAYFVSLIENIQREDLSPTEKARGYKTILDKFGLTHDELAKKIGKSRPAITNTLRLLELPDYIVEAVDLGKIREGHIRSLINIDNETVRRKLFEKILREKLTSREAETIAGTVKPAGKYRNKPKIFNEYRQISKTLEQKLGTKADIRPFSKKAKRGSIIIYFYSEDEFNRLYSRLIK